jgi:uncharacterized membrane protein YqjE
MSESKNRLAAIVTGCALLLFAAVGFGWLLAHGSAANLAAVTQSR